MAKEIRSYQIRSTVEENRIRGYAAVFNSPSEDFGGFREVIEPGAFTSAIEGADVRLLFNHDNSRVMARSTAGTLQVFEDEQGLGFVADIGEQSYARDALVSLERGDVNQMSFGFTIDPDEGWSFEKRDKQLFRVIKKVDRLLELSIVSFPAYEATNVELARAQFRAYKQEHLRDVEALRTRLIHYKIQLWNT